MTEQLFTREGSTRFLRACDHEKGYPQGLVKIRCGRCGGEGRSDKWALTGYTCYDCGGAGTRGDRAVRLYTAEQLAKLNATRDKRQEKVRAVKQAAYQAEQARIAAEADARKAKNAADPLFSGLAALIDAADVYRGPDPFLADMWRRIQHYDLSEAQRAAVQKYIDAAAERAAKIAVAHHVGEIGERIEFCGTVDRVHQYEAKPYMSYGNATVTKEIVTIRTDDGAPLVWFTSWSQLKRGMRVTGKGTVKEHKTFRDEPQTTLQRVKVTASPAQPQA